MTSVAVIGSGVMGTVAARALQRSGVDVAWYSQDTVAGGLWSADSAHCRTYPSLFMITPHSDSVLARDRAGVVDGDRYLHWSEYADYLSALGRSVAAGVDARFATQVVSCRPFGNRWRVVAEGPDGPHEATFDQVVNATGRSGVRRYVGQVPQRTAYAHWHAADHGTAPGITGARCLVIGIGPSGADIACDLAARGNRVDVSFRSPAWLVPKYVLGRPARLSSPGPVARRVVRPLKRQVAPTLIRTLIGRQDDWGLPSPEQTLLDTTPVPSDLFIHALRHRLVRVRPAVTELATDTVLFADGSRGEYDAVVSATGYDWAYPHLPAEVSHEARTDGLLLGMLPTSAPGLVVLNGFRCRGAAMACAEIQAAVTARAVTGELPAPQAWRDPQPLAPTRARSGFTGPDYLHYLRKRLGNRLAAQVDPSRAKDHS